MNARAFAVVALSFCSLQPVGRAAAQSPEPVGSDAAADVATTLQSLLADKQRSVLFRTGDIWLVVQANAVQQIEGNRLTIKPKSWIRRCATPSLPGAPWSRDRIYETMRLGWQHNVHVRFGETALTPLLKEQMQLPAGAQIGLVFISDNDLMRVERAMPVTVEEIAAEPLARPGDGPRPGDAKGAWKTVDYSAAGGLSHFKYQWATNGVVQLTVTKRVNKPPKIYRSQRLVPPARPGESRLPAELETLFLEHVAERLAAPAADLPSAVGSEDGSSLDVELLINAFEYPENYHSYNVALTYTMRDAASGELMARVNGFAFVRGEEKFLVKDIVSLAEVCIFPGSF